jgi:two-component system LytT family response regulator
MDTSGMIIRTLIIDDEPVACDLLNWMLHQDPDIKVLGACQDGRSALTAIREKRPDLIFLDVQMPELDGFALLKNLKTEEKPYLIFVTAYDHYAIRAFDFEAIDYLLKPFNQRRFRKALTRAKDQICRAKRLDNMQKDPQHPIQYVQRLEIKKGGHVYYLPVSEITWIEAADQYANIHCLSGSYLIRQTMAWLEQHLDPMTFVRIHRSVIVHVHQVREAALNREQGPYLILRDGKKLNISRRRLAALRKSSLSSSTIRGIGDQRSSPPD